MKAIFHHLTSVSWLIPFCLKFSTKATVVKGASNSYNTIKKQMLHCFGGSFCLVEAKSYQYCPTSFFVKYPRIFLCYISTFGSLAYSVELVELVLNKKISDPTSSFLSMGFQCSYFEHVLRSDFVINDRVINDYQEMSGEAPLMSYREWCNTFTMRLM